MEALAQSWLSAARTPTIAAELESIFTLIADETVRQRPTCVASGRCCNFANHGHLLYVTGLEAAYTVSRLPFSPSLGEGAGGRAPGDPTRVLPPVPRSLSLTQISSARTRGDCPFLINNLCSVHTIKPIGCRVYFCDPTAQQWQQDLSERALARLRAIHDHYEIPYRYGEWRSMLEAVTSDP